MKTIVITVVLVTLTLATSFALSANHPLLSAMALFGGLIAVGAVAQRAVEVK